MIGNVLNEILREFAKKTLQEIEQGKWGSGNEDALKYASSEVFDIVVQIYNGFPDMSESLEDMMSSHAPDYSDEFISDEAIEKIIQDHFTEEEIEDACDGGVLDRDCLTALLGQDKIIRGTVHGSSEDLKERRSAAEDDYTDALNSAMDNLMGMLSVGTRYVFERLSELPEDVLVEIGRSVEEERLLKIKERLPELMVAYEIMPSSSHARLAVLLEIEENPVPIARKFLRKMGSMV